MTATGPATLPDAYADARPRPTPPGATVWLTGLPSAGKSTIAAALAGRLAPRGRPVEVLDGDLVRPHLSQGLGFSRADRSVNVRRIGWVAHLLARHGVLAVVPVIAPYAQDRAAVRALHAERGVAYVEVHVTTPPEVAGARDVKGLYARARAGQLSGMTGVDDPYEVPAAPEVRIDTHDRSVDDSVDALVAELSRRGLL